MRCIALVVSFTLALSIGSAEVPNVLQLRTKIVDTLSDAASFYFDVDRSAIDTIVDVVKKNRPHPETIAPQIDIIIAEMKKSKDQILAAMEKEVPKASMDKLKATFSKYRLI